MGLVVKRVLFLAARWKSTFISLLPRSLACTVKQWGMPADVAVLINAFLERVD